MNEDLIICIIRLILLKNRAMVQLINKGSSLIGEPVSF